MSIFHLISVISLAFATPSWAEKTSAREQTLKEVQQIVETSTQKILSILKDQTLKKEERRTQVVALVDPLFNFGLIAKLSLGRKHWGKLSPGQRKEFTALFIKQLQDSYLDKLDLLSDETVEVGQAKWEKKKIHVPTSVLSKDKRYDVTYKLYSNKGQWLAYDVEIEGVSIVKSYSLQYDQFLAKNSLQDLIRKMKNKVFGPPEALKQDPLGEGVEKKETALSTKQSKKQTDKSSKD